MPRCRTCRAAYREGLYKRKRAPIGDSKKCRKCEKVKDLSDFVRDRRSPDGYSPRCAECRRSYAYRQDARTTRDRFLRWKYGITLEEFEAMVEKQGGVCAACGNGQNYTGRMNLDLDHCHVTKLNRELLCSNCNRALGMLGDDPVRIEALARYARKWAAIHAGNRGEVADVRSDGDDSGTAGDHAGV